MAKDDIKALIIIGISLAVLVMMLLWANAIRPHA